MASPVTHFVIFFTKSVRLKAHVDRLWARETCLVCFMSAAGGKNQLTLVIGEDSPRFFTDHVDTNRKRDRQGNTEAGLLPSQICHTCRLMATALNFQTEN